jgi:hypothetical protein
MRLHHCDRAVHVIVQHFFTSMNQTTVSDERPNQPGEFEQFPIPDRLPAFIKSPNLSVKAGGDGQCQFGVSVHRASNAGDHFGECVDDKFHLHMNDS